ncbi:response regulator transcription factor [Flagellimonas flava]|uniref:Regulatory protein, luxR family n=1 Tax=Flagellimonas flava TaxID=570519 RepID=A0A1M5NME5_9FLAO|nr:helix-turn-helix transcriptional regulator [Allomuricauda flava]SHG90764.1 regulatory protein, luxR family [Allomuricauda flava]
MVNAIKKNRLLVFSTMIVIIGVLIFNVFQYSASYGIVEINNINSLFLVPFILLVYGLGMALGTVKGQDEIERVYQNQLSKREREVIKLISAGKQNQEIADELFVDLSTIKSHINRIYKKTGMKNRKELRFYGKEAMERFGNP